MKRKAGLRIALLVGLTAVALLTSGPVGMTATCLAVLAGLSALGTAMEVVACRWFCRLLIYGRLFDVSGPRCSGGGRCHGEPGPKVVGATPD